MQIEIKTAGLCPDPLGISNIYHASINGNPYTIKFKAMPSGKFKAVQMYGKYNCNLEYLDKLVVEEILKEVANFILQFAILIKFNGIKISGVEKVAMYQCSSGVL